MSDAKHTPRPFSESLQAGILDANGDVIACIYGVSGNEHQERRDFIIRACNAHDALLAAWELFFEKTDEIERDGSERAKTLISDLINGSLGPAIDAGLHAIALAKGKTE